MWAGNVPLSVDNNVIDTALKKLGYEMRSTVRKELARDKTGKRAVGLSLLPFPRMTPLPKICTMGILSVELYHPKMKRTETKAERNALFAA